MNPQIEPIEPDSANPPPVPLSSATRVGQLLFVSGQGSTDEKGSIIADTFDAEFWRTIDNLKRVLGAAGAGLDDIIRVGAYLRDEESRSRYNELYREAFSEPYPARTTVGNHFSFIQIEIDCVALLSDGADPTRAGA